MNYSLILTALELSRDIRKMVAVAKTMVNANKLRVMGVNRIPHGV